MTLDLQNTLCLACSSSILSKDQVLHITNCCKQVICNACIQANPRLATYDPCLACLGGVGATRGKTKPRKAISPSASHLHAIKINDGETMFTLGDDSDEDAEEQEIYPQRDASASSHLSTPSSQGATDFPTNNAQFLTSTSLRTPPDLAQSALHSPTGLESTSQQRFYINSQDTIHGIALRCGIDARELCQYNKLPFSTLSTTPHLLHTRLFLELPPSSKPLPLRYVLSEADQAERDARRAKERAQKRLQMVTKEVDWRVAKTYIALADDPDIAEELVGKQKEGYGTSGSTKPVINSSNSVLESRAVDMYFEDEEWEQSQLNANSSTQISPFPLTRRPPDGDLVSVVKTKWWSWKSS